MIVKREVWAKGEKISVLELPCEMDFLVDDAIGEICIDITDHAGSKFIRGKLPIDDAVEIARMILRRSGNGRKDD